MLMPIKKQPKHPSCWLDWHKNVKNIHFLPCGHVWAGRPNPLFQKHTIVRRVNMSQRANCFSELIKIPIQPNEFFTIQPKEFFTNILNLIWIRLEIIVWNVAMGLGVDISLFALVSIEDGTICCVYLKAKYFESKITDLPVFSRWKMQPCFTARAQQWQGAFT